jgi:coenzyme Q-binding protein COQ10
VPSAEANEVFNCTVPEFYKIISDYEKYPEFLQEVKSCKVEKSDGPKKLVEYKVSVVKSFTYKLWMTESEPNSITWTFGGGDIFKTSDGSWQLEDHGGKCRAIYKVDANFSMFVPGMIAKTLLNVNLPMMMSSYHKRVKDLYGK